jgi:hypothetical protein
MTKRYMVIAFGTAKKTGNPYSRAYLLKGDKEGKFGYLDSRDSFFTNDMRPVGTIINVEQAEV